MRSGIVVCCLCLVGMAAPVRAAAPSEPLAAPGGWQMVFADEFDGAQLDASKWTFYEDCWGGGNQERQCYTARPANISLHDGRLDLSARFEQVSGPALPLDMRKPDVETPLATKPFTSGKISTLGKFSITYGRIEVRAKLPVGQGVWPAIWLLPDHNLYGRWPGSGEIDVMEAVNTGVGCNSCVGSIENNVYGTIHYGSYMHHQMQQKAAQLPKGTIDGWHVYRVDWTADDIDWYVDDHKYYHVKLSNWRDTLQKGDVISASEKKAPFDRPFYLILNLAVGGLWPESHDAGGVALKDYPKSFGIDWVHIYSCGADRTCS